MFLLTIFLLSNSSVSPIFRISYMWYSFLGCILTILFGLLISFITEVVAKSQISSINASSTADGEKPVSPVISHHSSCPDTFVSKESQAIFIVEKYRKTSQQHLHSNRNLKGIDNPALKMEET